MNNKLIVAGCKEAIDKMRIELLSESSEFLDLNNQSKKIKINNEKNIKKYR